MSRREYVTACGGCGQQFNMWPSQIARVRRDPKAHVFCSRACAGVTRAEAKCAHCGGAFHPNQVQRVRLRNGGVAYCSVECFTASRSTFKCAACGNVFYSTNKRLPNKGGAIVCQACVTVTDSASVARTDAWLEANV